MFVKLLTFESWLFLKIQKNNPEYQEKKYKRELIGSGSSLNSTVVRYGFMIDLERSPVLLKNSRQLPQTKK